jgi:dynein light chain roadblock-type
MSEVEETIERIKVQQGIEGYVICNKQGQVLRRYPDMSQEDAEIYASRMMSLAFQARSVVRDLNPKNELRYLRVRAKKHEIMVAYDVQFVVIVIQKWTPAGERRDQ